MDEEFMIRFRAVIAEEAKKIVMEVLNEELPKILVDLQKPGGGLSDYIDYDKAVEILGITKATLHNYIITGKITKYTLMENGKPYVRMSEIEKMMKGTRRVNPELGHLCKN